MTNGHQLKTCRHRRFHLESHIVGLPSIRTHELIGALPAHMECLSKPRNTHVWLTLQQFSSVFPLPLLRAFARCWRGSALTSTSPLSSPDGTTTTREMAISQGPIAALQEVS